MRKTDIDLLKFLKIAFDTKPNHAFYNKKYKSIAKKLIRIKNINKKKKKINFFFNNFFFFLN